MSHIAISNSPDFSFKNHDQWIVRCAKGGDVIIILMISKARPIRSNEVINVAFAVVFFASYLSTFQLFRSSSTIQLGIFIILGISYLATGIYGYETIRKIRKKGLMLLYFLFQCLLGAVIVYFQQDTGLNALILLPLVGQAVLSLTGNAIYLANLFIILSYTFANLLHGANIISLLSGLPGFLAGQFFILVFTQMALDEENARLSVQKLADELAEANEELRQYAHNVEELTLSTERNRMAREIHDGLGHSLTIILMQLQACRVMLKKSPQEAIELTDAALEQTRLALMEVRNSVFALRSGGEDNISLSERVKNMMEASRLAGIVPELKIVGDPITLNPQLELMVYRTLQECLSNTFKHAHAKTISVELNYSQKNHLSFQYLDNGIGANTIKEGYGITGIKERVALLNGIMSIETKSGMGTTIKVEVPY